MGKKINTLLLALLLAGSLFMVGAMSLSGCGGGEDVVEDDDEEIIVREEDDWGDEEQITSIGGFSYEFLAVINGKTREIPGGTFEVGTEDLTFPDRFPRHEVTLESFLLINTSLSVNSFQKFIDICNPYKERTISYPMKLRVKDYEAILARDPKDWLTVEKDEANAILNVTCNMWSDEGWEFIQSNGIFAPAGWPEPKARSQEYQDFIRDQSEFPISGLSYYEAEAACRAFGVRLPTEFEYEVAASGGGENDYPWGDELDYTKAAWNDQGTQLAGQFFQGNTDTGLSDMVGGLQQWTSSDYELYYDPNNLGRYNLSEDDENFLREYAQNNDKRKANRERNGKSPLKVTRGSSYVDIDYNKKVHYRLPLPKETRDQRVGFRFCHSDMIFVQELWQQETDNEGFDPQY